MRKTITALAALTVVAFTLTACGDDPAVESDSAASGESSKTEPSVNPDSDGDNVSDARDPFPADPNEWADTDSNNVGDNEDARVAQAKIKAEIKAEAKREKAAQQRKIDRARVPTERQWAQVVKDPDDHTGEYYRIYGQIWQFDAATGTDTFLAYTANRNTMSYGYFEGADAMLTGSKKLFKPFVEDDVFVATVQVEGSYSYDTQIGGNTTVPLLKVHRIALD
jgi:hypothetical protein